MRGFRFGLTGRGLAVLVFGGPTTMGASLIGESDLTWVGVFVICLPVMGLAVVLVLPPCLTCKHPITPGSLLVGEMARVQLSVTSNRTAPFFALGLRDRLPDTLGRGAMFELVRGPGRWRQAAEYDAATRQCGHFQIDPLRVRNLDAFRMTWRSRQTTGDITSLRVTPRLRALSLPRGGQASRVSGDVIPQCIGNVGTDDILVREHHRGDGTRRAYWRMSAEHRELMVQLEEQPQGPAMAIIVDTRAVAYIGSSPESTLEWVLSLGVSLVIELLRDRFRVSLLSVDGAIFRPTNGESTGAAARLLATVTDVESSGHAFLEDCLADLDALGTVRTVVAGLGLPHSRDVAALVAATAQMADIDVLVPDAWALHLPADVVVAHEKTCRLLIISGWNMMTFGPEATMPQDWGRLVVQREAQRRATPPHSCPR